MRGGALTWRTAAASRLGVYAAFDALGSPGRVDSVGKCHYYDPNRVQETMAKPNYAHQKKLREEAARKKREEKQQRRQPKKDDSPPLAK